MKDINYFTSEKLTIGEFLNKVSECSDDAILLESCFNVDYTKKLFEKDIDNFEPIVGFYDEVYEVMFVSEFSRNHKKAKTLKEFKEFIERGNIDINFQINRDVEDSYRYEYFENIIYSKDVIILL